VRIRASAWHYYFYFIDEEFGLCYLRVPTWAPFACSSTATPQARWPARSSREGIDFVQEDNAYLRIADWRARRPWRTH